MTVVLPSTPRAKRAKPRFIDMGGVTEPALGGSDQRLDRLGSRWAVEYTMPPMNAEEARVWVARLTRGTREKAAAYFPQPGLSLNSSASAQINGAHAANIYSITIKNLTLVTTIYEGQFISIIKGGKRYIHQATSDRTGAGAMSIFPSIRVALVGDEVIEVGTPIIEGYVQGPQDGWDIDEAKKYGLTFAIREAA